jgi:8-oxo-dGTP diphosphatase
VRAIGDTREPSTADGDRRATVRSTIHNAEVAVRATTDVTDHGVRTLAADGAVLVDGEVVLLRRDHPPFEGTWVLPGGMVERGERAATACVREVEEETGLDVRVVEFLGLYDAPDRDPRGVVSAGYLCRAVGDGDPEPRDEADAIGTFPPEDMPETGFDHREIVADAVGR